jgi:hypothetical protein
VLNFTLLGIRVFVWPDVRRNTLMNEVNFMIMILSWWKTFGNIFKYFGMLINDPLEILMNIWLRCLNIY